MLMPKPCRFLNAWEWCSYWVYKLRVEDATCLAPSISIVCVLRCKKNSTYISIYTTMLLTRYAVSTLCVVATVMVTHFARRCGGAAIPRSATCRSSCKQSTPVDNLQSSPPEEDYIIAITCQSLCLEKVISIKGNVSQIESKKKTWHSS